MAEAGDLPPWTEGLNKRQVEAVLYVGKHRRISRGEYAELLAVFSQTAAPGSERSGGTRNSPLARGRPRSILHAGTRERVTRLWHALARFWTIGAPGPWDNRSGYPKRK